MNHIVFGATGFIGSHVAEALAESGETITAIVRPGSNTDFLQQLGVKTRTLSAFSDDELCQVLHEGDVIYNCIADVHLYKNLAQYNQTQVDVTKTLAEAAVQVGVERFIQLSTVKVYGDTPEHFITEDQAFNPLFDFHQTMIDRETALKQIASNSGLKIILLQPAATLGRRSPVLKYFLEAHSHGSFPMIGNGQAKFSAIDTRDIGRAMVFLAKADLSKENIFLLKGYETSWQNLKEKLDEVRSITSKSKSLPKWAAKAMASVWETLTPYGRQPFLTRFMVHDATQTLLVDDSRIRSLGFKPKHDIQDTLHYISKESTQMKIALG